MFLTYLRQVDITNEVINTPHQLYALSSLDSPHVLYVKKSPGWVVQVTLHVIWRSFTMSVIVKEKIIFQIKFAFLMCLFPSLVVLLLEA